MIEIAFGRPGNGKTLYTCKVIRDLCKRAVKIKKKYGFERKVWVNIPIAQWFKNLYPGVIIQWQDPIEFVKEKGIDIVYDEIAVDFGAAGWKDTPRELKDFFAQHRHLGVEIYANTQDYKDVDINIRRRVHRALLLKKMLGSRDPSPTMPPVKHVWGWIVGREVDPQQVEDDSEVKIDIMEMLIPKESFVITKFLCNMYDTEYLVKHHTWTYRHDKRICPDCGFEKIIHT